MGKITKTTGPSNAGAEPVVDEPAPAADEPVYDDPPDTDTEAEETPDETDSAGPSTPTGDDAPAEGPPPPVRRPPVNAPKGDHLDYGVTRYGLDRGYLDDEFNKADLVAKLTALDDDKAHIVDGRIADGPAGPHAVADPPDEDTDDAAAGDAETDEADDSDDQGDGDTADTPA